MFQKVVASVMLPGLVVPHDYGDEVRTIFLPLSEVYGRTDEIRDRLRAALVRNEIEPKRGGLGGINWKSVAAGLRAGTPTTHKTIAVYRKILRDLQLDWTPCTPNLPSHGSELPNDSSLNQ